MPGDDKLTAGWRAEIIAFDLKAAEELEQQAMALMPQAAQFRELADKAKDLPSEGIRRTYVAMRAEMQKAKRERSGKEADEVVVSVAEESERRN
jgi:hypothetical protein